MIYLGIDPGLDGAIAAVCDGEVAFAPTVIDTPTADDGKKRRYVVNAMRAAILSCCQGSRVGGKPRAAIERVHAMPKQGVTSSFSFGEGFGLWQGLLAGLSISFDLVEPTRWKRDMLAGASKEKGASRVRAAQLFPGVDLHLVKHHGRGDALLIAEWRRRQG